MNSDKFVNVTFVNSKGETKVLSNSSDTTLYDFSSPGTYTVHVDDYSTEVTLHLGGVYALLVIPTSDGFVSINYNPSFTFPFTIIIRNHHSKK